MSEWSSLPSSLHRLGSLDITVLVSFPPLVGHTTLTTLCGFAYGMKGFFISAIASVVGSAAAFMALRYLFSERIRQWSAHNEKWQALESVVVCSHVHTLTTSVSHADEFVNPRKLKVYL